MIVSYSLQNLDLSESSTSNEPSDTPRDMFRQKSLENLEQSLSDSSKSFDNHFDFLLSQESLDILSRSCSEDNSVISLSSSESEVDSNAVLLVIEQEPVYSVSDIFKTREQNSKSGCTTSQDNTSQVDFSSDQTNITNLISQSCKEATSSIYSSLSKDTTERRLRAARKFPINSGHINSLQYKKHIRTRSKEQKELPNTVDFLDYLCLSNEVRNKLPKQYRRFSTTNVPFH